MDELYLVGNGLIITVVEIARAADANVGGRLEAKTASEWVQFAKRSL